MKRPLLIIIVGLLLFVPFLGSVRLFDWDEINFAENAREMIVTGDYLHMQIDYRPFYEKPPLFIWLQVLSMKVFGVNEFAARLPNAVIGVFTLLVVYQIGRGVRGDRFGLLWAVAYAGSLLPHFYARSGIIDPLFNLFIFLGVWSLPRYGGVVAGLFAGLAVMTKGPVGYGLIVLTTGITWLMLRNTTPLPWRQVLTATLVAAVLPAIWFGLDYLQNGPTFIRENIAYQIRLLTTGDAGHEQPWYYHSVVVLIGCFPASIFFFGGLRASDDETSAQRDTRVRMTVLFFVVLVVFSLVKTKIVHYSSMTYLPLTYLAALTLDRWIANGTRLSWRYVVPILVVGSVLAAVMTAIPLAIMNKAWLLGLPTFRDVYLRAALARDVAWIGVEPLVGLILLAGAVSFAFFVRRQRPPQAIGVLFGSVALFIALFLPLIAPKIEPYTQGAALDFYTSLRGKDVYVKPLTMKSYAHLFYTDKQPHLSGSAMGITADAWEPWLLTARLDRPAYFVAKVNDAEPWRRHPNLRVVREEGGFVFFERAYLADSTVAVP